MSDIKISLFKPSKTKEGYKPGTKPHVTDFYTEMNKIKNGTHYPVISKLREMTDPDQKRLYKAAKLEAFTISALCPDRREIKGAIPSGLLAIDLDPGKNPTITDWAEVRDMIFSLPEVVASFLSASGNGVAFVVKINPKKLKDVFYSIKDELDDNFGLKLDAGCHDIVRLRFVSHDHDARIRDDFDSIPLKEPSAAYLANKKAKDEAVIEWTGQVDDANCDRAWSYAVKAAEQKIGQFGDGSKHVFLAALAGFCNTIGMNQTYCESRVQAQFGSMTDISTDRLLKPVRNIYKAYPHKFNTYIQTVETRRLKSKIVGEVVQNYIRKGIKSKDLTENDLDVIAQKFEANIDRVKEVVERVSDEYSEEYNADAKADNLHYPEFWYVDEENKVALSRMQFRNFLTAKGIWRLEVEKDWILVRIEQGVVEEIQKAHIKHIVMTHLEKLREFEVWEVIANRVSSVFSDDYLELLPSKDIQFYRDGRSNLSLFYLNGIVNIQPEEIGFIEWKDFTGYVWKNKIIQRNIELDMELSRPIDSIFVKFLTNVSKNDDDRFRSLCSSLAYMLHGYKSKSLLPVWILNDEAISDTPEGGTGKGLMIESLKQFKRVTVINGKDFDFTDKFKWQQVDMDTDIIYIDDAKKNFQFENLFSGLTEGIDVEKKNSHKFKLPFSISPKMAISTNYAIQGEGNSHARRKHESELAQFYSKSFTPRHEFGKDLFDDFDEAEWLAFDNFIIRCCAVYLKDGLIEQKLVNQPLKQLYAAVSSEFVKWMDEEYNDPDHRILRIDQNAAYSAYMHLYPGKLGSKAFYGFMEKYYDYHGIKYVRKKIGSNRYFIIGNGGELF